MILSNEQRAHDYALTVLLSVRDQKVVYNEKHGTEDIPIDVLELYLELYQNALQKFNSLFVADK